MDDTMKVLVLGVSGMLGNAVFRLLGDSPEIDVRGTARSASAARRLPEALRTRIVPGIDVENFDSLTRAFATFRPDAVINCVGLVKQLAEADDALAAIPINSMLPHRLARLCEVAGARLVHVSTDCVFAGTRGMYKEDDPPDAQDLYGRSKLLGEVRYPHTVTLRTSIIGHELEGAHGLIGWFLSQQGPVRGFRRAVFSGLPTVELATVIRDRVLADARLSGLHHVAAAPIAKFDLLRLVAAQYRKAIDINPDDSVVIDRSLDGSRFSRTTGYVAPPWEELVRRMHTFG
jgi:dTDP-4-dehydrorhamnose reductase